jgi:hypothetical protein
LVIALFSSRSYFFTTPNFKKCNDLSKNMSSLLVDYVGPRHAGQLKIVGMAGPTSPHDAATKEYVDANTGTNAGITSVYGTDPIVSTPGQNSATISISPADGTTSGYVSGTANTLGGDFNFTGQVEVRTPLGPSECATKDYVDAHSGTGGNATTIYGTAPIIATSALGSSTISMTPASGTTSGYVSGSSNTLGGTFIFSNTTDSSSTSTGAIQALGGLAVAKSLYVGGSVNINSLNFPTPSVSLDIYSIYNMTGTAIIFDCGFNPEKIYAGVVDLHFTRIGRNVTMTWDFGATGSYTLSPSLNNASAFGKFECNLSSTFRPTHSMRIPCMYYTVNNVLSTGNIFYDSTQTLYCLLLYPSTFFDSNRTITLWNGSCSYSVY